MTIRLDDQVAVVTGAGRGIGREVALLMAERGARVVVNDLGTDVGGDGPGPGPADDVVAIIAERGGDAVASAASVASAQGGAEVIRTAVDTYGRLDILVCAAGIMRPTLIFDLPEADWDAVLATNLTGHFNVMQPAVRIMADQRAGTIITFTSSGGLQGSPHQPNYAASKEGILGLTRSVALTIAPYATCNSISPHAWTRMQERMNHPRQDMPGPEHVAPVAVFLASDAARHITGQVIGVDGERVSLFPQPRPVRSVVQAGGWTPESLAEQWDAALGTDQLVRYERYHSPESPEYLGI
jgi:NAD(P)-dependent dehydrogenase (short-subunit alcohol dehydrogenase family)